MSMSTHVVGIKPPDAKFQKMYDAWKACEDAGVEIPAAVDKFFNGENPDPAGVIVDLDETKKGSGVTEYHDEASQGFEVDLTKIDKNIKILRFYNSW